LRKSRKSLKDPKDPKDHLAYGFVKFLSRKPLLVLKRALEEAMSESGAFGEDDTEMNDEVSG
jgi:hypothetical protein